MGGRILKFSAVIALLGLVVAAVVVKGFEHGDIKLNTQNLWILHKTPLKTGTGTAPYYGQVNTGLGELTTVNSVAKTPGSILQSEYGAIIFEDANVSMADIRLASPVDYAKESTDFRAVELSTNVSIAGNLVTFFGASQGAVAYTNIVEGKTYEPKSIGRPSDLTDSSGYAAATASANGLIYVYSTKTKKVYTYDTASSNWVGSGADVSGAGTGKYEITAVNSKWVLLETTSGKVWVQGSGSRTLTNSLDAKLQAPAGSGSYAYVSTATSMFSIKLDTGDVKEEGTFNGTNSRPVYFDGNVYAAWLSSGSGQLFSTSSPTPIELTGFDGGQSLPTDADPVIQTNGSAAVVNDAQSGWAWTIPDGQIIPSTQNWQSKIVPPPPPNDGEEVAKKQEPPVAVDDNFGARAGVLTTLPVLLNDHDPNRQDVLTIDPASVSGFDSGKGTLRISADGQSFSLLAKETATGSLSFAYRVSDGSQAHGQLSKQSATVTVAFKGAGNTAPVWCSDAPTPCEFRTMPAASVQPGQSVTVKFAEGFIDPEGDKLFISAAEIMGDASQGSVGFNSSGEVIFRSRHPKGTSGSVKVAVTVSDIRGASVTKSLSIKIDPNNPLTFTPFVVSSVVGQTRVIDLAQGVAGAVGAVEVAKPEVDKLEAKIEKVGPTSISVTSDVAQQLQIAGKITDETGVQVNFYVQVNVLEDKLAEVAVSPVSVLVRPGLDSTVDLYTAITNPSERSLLITLDEPQPEPGASLKAGKVKGGFVRVRGSTENRTAGLIGSVKYTVTDGTGDGAFSAVGQIFVYQLATASTAPIGVDDSITLRAESTGDLPVLANDVGTPGISLTISAKDVSCKGTGFDEAGGIAFAAHGVVRVIAPTKKGTYHCSYGLYASDSPSQKGSANFTVMVSSKSSNERPIPPTLKARVTTVAPIEIAIPLTGIDPDGDSVELVRVGSSTTGKGYAAVSAKGNSIIYAVVPGSEGQDSFEYTVSDGELESVGVVNIGIFTKTSTEGPVTMVDIVDLVAGSGGKAVFDPTANDYDTNGNGLTLVKGSVLPNLKQGTPAFEASAKLVAEPTGNSRNVTITAPKEAGEYEFVYSVADAFGAKQMGMILVRVTKKAVPDQPEVTDTYVTVAERSQLASAGIDVVTKKITWLTGDPTKLKLSLVGNTHGFRASGNTKLIGAAPRESTFVVFKLSGQNFAGEAVETYGILHIPRENRIINLKDPAKIWNVDEGATATEDVLDWVSVAAGARLEINAAGVKNSISRPEANCKFEGGTRVSYSAGNGGTKFNDVCVVPIRYVGDKTFTEVPLRIHVKAKNPSPIFTDVPIEVMPGSEETLDLKSMVSWDQPNPVWDWTFTKIAGSSITYEGPTSDVVTFKVVPGSEARETTTYRVGIKGEDGAYGTVTVVVGESPNDKPKGTLTFENCDIKSGSCELHVSDLTGVVNAFATPLKFMPIGYTKGTANYKAGQTIHCQAVSIRVTDVNTVTATWDVKKGVPRTQVCPAQAAPGALLDEENKKGTLMIAVDIQGVPQSPLKVEQVAFSRSTVTLRITAGDFEQGENQVTSYMIREGKAEFECKRDGNEAFTTCDPIEDLRPWHGNDSANLHTYSVTAKNRVGESAATKAAKVYAYEKLRRLTPDVIDAVTVSGRESSQTLGVASVTIKPNADPLAAKYIIRGEGGGQHTEVIDGNYKERTFEISAKPGKATEITVTAEGSVKPPVNGTLEASSTTWTGQISGTPSLGAATAKVLGSSAPYVGKITVADVNRNYSLKPSQIAYIFYPGIAPTCTFDSKTNTLSVSTVQGAIVKRAEDKNYNDQVSTLTSPDVSGLLENVTYSAKVCYSNGFGEDGAGVKQVIAPNSLSTLKAPGSEDFKYTVKLAATPNEGDLATWKVEIASQPTIPAGVKAQFSSTKSGKARWENTIYSEFWGERPTILVRYCNTAETICSDTAVVKPADDAKSWQIRITRAYLVTPDQNATELPTCDATRRPLDLNFGLKGDGLTGWLGATPDSIDSGNFLAQYQLEGAETWNDLDDSRSFYRLTTSVPKGKVKKLQFWVQPNGGTTSKLEKVQVTIDVTC